jgi:hypothetical protein
VWKSKYKTAMKNGEPLPVEPDTTLAPPVKRRLLVMDATPEKLHEILADNPAGVTVLRDELVGLIAEMDKEGRESQRSFYLQAWNGYGGHTIDRIGRGSIHVPHLCISLFGLIQPARHRHYLAETLEGGPGDDGLLQRFQIIVWPDTSAEWTLVDRPPDNTGLARAEKVFSRLANLPTESVRMRFAPDAQAFFFHWWKSLEEKVRAENGLHPALVSHLSKYRSLLPTLAGLFQLADLASEDRPITDDSPVAIDINHTQQAAAMCFYLEAHAIRMYSCIVTPELHAARTLAKHIQRHALPRQFTAREISRHSWAALDTPERIAGALNLLENYSWLRSTKKRKTHPAVVRPSYGKLTRKLLNSRLRQFRRLGSGRYRRK